MPPEQGQQHHALLRRRMRREGIYAQGWGHEVTGGPWCSLRGAPHGRARSCLGLLPASMQTKPWPVVPLHTPLQPAVPLTASRDSHNYRDYKEGVIDWQPVPCDQHPHNPPPTAHLSYCKHGTIYKCFISLIASPLLHNNNPAARRYIPALPLRFPARSQQKAPTCRAAAPDLCVCVNYRRRNLYTSIKKGEGRGEQAQRWQPNAALPDSDFRSGTFSRSNPSIVTETICILIPL